MIPLKDVMEGSIMKLKYIFGPVLSRRLGRSLGIDLIPFKTCSMDCIYCECGRTTDCTAERMEYTPTEEVIKEIKKYLSTEPDIDYLTFAGSGEPTLHSDIGKVISFIKNNYPRYKVALITNSTFLNKREVRREVSRVDLIVPSLDAVSSEAFNKINRPVKELTPEKVIAGLTKLRKEYTGEIWLEIFLVPGINDNEKELHLFKEAIKKIKPDKVQLNTLDRPGTESWVKAISRDRLNSIADYLGKDTELVL